MKGDGRGAIHDAKAEEHGPTEGMAVFAPIYRLLGNLPVARDISN